MKQSNKNLEVFLWMLLDIDWTFRDNLSVPSLWVKQSNKNLEVFRWMLRDIDWTFRDNLSVPYLCVKQSNKNHELLFWDVTRHRLVVCYRRFGTTYWSNLKG